MPHLTLEYTSNLPSFKAAEALRLLNATLIASGHFEAVDIKSRAWPIDTFLVGDTSHGHGFVYIQLALLSGRSDEIKRSLSDQLLHTLRQCCVWPEELRVQLCVEIQEIHQSSYAKLSLGP